jgi:hypothetical protein
MNTYHTKQVGSIGHLAVMHDLAKRGLPVFTEYSDNSKADIITIVRDAPILVQVKARTVKNGVIRLDTRKTAKGYSFRYKETDFDVLAIYILDTEQVAYMSVAEFLVPKTCITLRVEPPLKKQSWMHWIDDYTDFEKALRDYTPRILMPLGKDEEIVQTTSPSGG